MGPKIQLGGEKEGLFRLAYQVGIEEKVKKEPAMPTNSQNRIAPTTLGQFDVFFFATDSD